MHIKMNQFFTFNRWYYEDGTIHWMVQFGPLLLRIPLNSVSITALSNKLYFIIINVYFYRLMNKTNSTDATMMVCLLHK